MWVDIKLNLNYHRVLARDENVKYLEEFVVICGYDVRRDLNAACLKTSILANCKGLKVG